MKYSVVKSALLGASALAIAASTTKAQGGLGVDARWYAWLGCWAADTAGNHGRVVSPNTTCFVPVTGSRAVEILTIGRDRVVSRDRIDVTGVPHAVDSQGCTGSETVNMSSTDRRVILSSSYNCTSNTQGSSTTIYSFLPGGKLLRVEVVRSGGGTVEMADRLRPVAIPGAVLSSAANAIESNQRTITTARANAAAAITMDEIVDIAHRADPEAVRLWVAASDQVFVLNNDQIALLTQSGLPTPVIQAVMNMGGGDSRGPTVFNENVYRGTMYATQPPVVVQEVQAPSYGYPGNDQNGIAPCPPPGFYPTNSYSAYNGMGYCQNTAYPYTPYSAYNAPYYPFGGFGSITTLSRPNVRQRGQHGVINRPNVPIVAVPRTGRPVGGRPIGRRP